jgi:hypothetical protein
MTTTMTTKSMMTTATTMTTIMPQGRRRCIISIIFLDNIYSQTKKCVWQKLVCGSQGQII